MIWLLHSKATTKTTTTNRAITIQTFTSHLLIIAPQSTPFSLHLRCKIIDKMNMKVEILSKKLVTPSSPTPHHLQTMKTSCFDELLPPNNGTTIFYYPASEKESSPNNGQRSDQLQKSLSEALTLYYPLAGRYIGSDLLVDCNDMGAEYVEARVSGNLSQILGGELDMQLLTQLAQYPLESNTSPLLVVQFNMFECGGAAIGVTMSHRIADGFSAFTFIIDWATTCRGGIDTVHKPSFTMGAIFPPRGVSPLKNIAPSDVVAGKIDGRKIVTKRFVIDGARITELKALVNGSKMLKDRPTRLETVTAFLWWTLIKAVKAKHGCLRPSLFSLPVNLRGRTSVPIPEYSFGNAFLQTTARFTPNDDESDVQLHDLVRRIHDAIASNVTKCAEASSDELFLIANNMLYELLGTYMKGDTDQFTCSSWCRFPIYEADFGWGKPDWVSGVQSPVEIVTLADAKDGDGIEAWVSLDEKLMHSFIQNLDNEATR